MNKPGVHLVSGAFSPCGHTPIDGLGVYPVGVRTNIDIDEELLAAAQRIAGTTTKRSTVEYALRELVRRKERQAILRLRGKVDWAGDLESSRRGRTA
jgi:Arc/MetJ family transcription regulator